MFLSENDHEKYTETTSKVLGESNLDENPAILELGIVADINNNTDKETANKIPNVVQRVQRKCEIKVTFRKYDEKEIPTKIKKQQIIEKGPNPKLSWFEENVIKKY